MIISKSQVQDKETRLARLAELYPLAFALVAESDSCSGLALRSTQEIDTQQARLAELYPLAFALMAESDAGTSLTSRRVEPSASNIRSGFQSAFAGLADAVAA